MNIASSAGELRRQLQPLRGRKTIAFVPTMGCLHAGHISLIEKARSLADVVLVSIYVNPLQFGPDEDLAAYPRTFEADSAACAAADVDFIFHPATLSPDSGLKVRLDVTDLADCLCGVARSGHFNGVATVVNMLFNIVQPDIAIFGEKDWQQLAMIRRMVDDLQMPLEIIAVPTMRELDGLAMSSRNRYLSGADRIQALALSGALKTMQQMVADGENDVRLLIHQGEKILAETGIQAEYLEVRDAFSLTAIKRLGGQMTRVFVAAEIGKARLIDNMPLPLGRQEMENN